jgi:hypothetical protein
MLCENLNKLKSGSQREQANLVIDSFLLNEQDKKIALMVSAIRLLPTFDVVYVLKNYIKEKNITSKVRDILENKTEVLFECDDKSYTYCANDFDGSPIFRKIGTMERVDLDLNADVKWLF